MYPFITKSNVAKKKQHYTTQELPEVLINIEKARKLTFDWAVAEGIKLLRVELLSPSIHITKSFAVWLFFDTDKQLKEYEANATIQKIEDKYLSSLKKLNCPDEYLTGVIFFKDTDENVQRFASLEPIKVG